MKFSLALLVAGLASASAFAPAFTPKASLTQVNAEPEEEGLDLNLEEMFDM